MVLGMAMAMTMMIVMMVMRMITRTTTIARMVVTVMMNLFRRNNRERVDRVRVDIAFWHIASSVADLAGIFPGSV